MRDKFIKNGIPYDELDVEMIETVDLLNFKLGLKTKYCCSGHGDSDKLYIMFHEDVEDELIHKLAKLLLSRIDRNHAIHLRLSYKIRVAIDLEDNRTIFKNWILESTLGSFSHQKRVKIIDAINKVLKENV